MKRVIVCIVLCFCIMPMVQSQCDFAEATREGVMVGYKINGDGSSVRVVPMEKEWPYYGEVKPSGELVLPDSVEWQGRKYVVTQVGRNAFYRCDGLLKVVLPNGISRIGAQAFNGCGLLQEVVMNEGLKEVGEGAFAYCRSLTSVVVPTSVTRIGISAFAECFLLNEVEMSGTLWKQVNDLTFSGCRLLKTARDEGLMGDEKMKKCEEN